MSPFKVERDIDIIVWGTWHHRAYPFRMFIQKKVTDWIKNCKETVPEEIPHAGLSLYDIVLNGNMYKLGTVSPRGNYYGTYLYRLLSRCKVSCTGPGLKHGSWIGTGKYFENAACGTITLSTPFDEADLLGFEHGKNIWFTKEERFEEDLVYLLESSQLQVDLSQNGMELIRTKHLPEVRAEEFYNFLQSKVGKI